MLQFHYFLLLYYFFTDVLSFDSSVHDNLDHFQSSFDRHKKTSLTEEGSRNNDSVNMASHLFDIFIN